jgi:DNA-binding NarL/FixJ family response regulator
MVVDKDRRVREGFSTFFHAQKDIKIVAESSSGLDVVNKFLVTNPDLVLMDLLLPGTNGIDVMRSLQEICPDVQVIFYTNSRGVHLTAAAKAAGAAKLLNKGIPGDELRKEIQKVLID